MNTFSGCEYPNTSISGFAMESIWDSRAHDPLEMMKAVKPERLDKSQKAHPCGMLHQNWVCVTWLVGVVNIFM